jgi:hypothetical protein
LTRAQLEHVIRAAAAIAGERDIIVVGSQAILGQFPDAPSELLVSNEADVYPKAHPERADVIDGSIGELSPFHEAYGYYAQGVGVGTAVLPAGWEARLVPVITPAGTGWCLEVHDLLVSKYVAGREKDRAYVRAALRHRLADSETLQARLAVTQIPDERKTALSELMRGDAAALAALGGD